MYYYLKGELALAEEDVAVVDCGGVGYKCSISRNTYLAIREKTEIKLFTYLSVKEDAMDLFGFSSEDERRMFILLISVSGVGPKAALSVLSEMTSSELAAAVFSSNAKRITAAQGVGPKMAQRICLELKDKISKFGTEVSGEDSAYIPFAASGVAEEAVSVLMALGYNKSDSEAAVRKCSAENTEDLVRQALRYLSRLI